MDNDIFKKDKSFRLINMYERLHKGEILYKEDIMNQFGISEKTFNRDISDLRIYFIEMNNNYDDCIVYDKKTNGYYLSEKNQELLTQKEVVALCKILLESRAFNTNELNQLINKLNGLVSVNNREDVKEIIRKELFRYVPLQHQKPLLNLIWDITLMVNKQLKVSMTYKRMDNEVKQHLVLPVGLMFSEFYFYLIAYIDNKEYKYPTVFRLDRIMEYTNTNIYFELPYSHQFDDGEFRKRVQFMYSGNLETVRFFCYENNLEAILDRLPSAKVISNNDEGYLIEAETFGHGIDMWLNSQGNNVRIIERIER